MEDNIYSVFMGNKWIYYRGFTKPTRNTSEKDMLSGSFSSGTVEGAPSSVLGLTPEEAALSLPKVSVRVGEGERPFGRIAAGPKLTSMVGNFVVGAGMCALIWHLTKPEEQNAKS